MINKHIISIICLLMFAGVVVAVNVYTPIPQDIPTTGHLYVEVRCEHGLFSHEMHLVNLDTGMIEVIYLNPDGKWDGERMPGRYLLFLLDGNAGHRESQEVTITAGETFRIMFLGHAVSGEGTPMPTVTTIPATIPPTTPTVTPTPIPPTPTTVPTSTPTPKPTPPCHDEKRCVPGYWSYTTACHVPIPVWHPGKCTVTRVCDRTW